MSTHDEAVARLRRLDACAVSDAMDQLGLAGAARGLGAVSIRAKVCGKVRTVRLGVGRPAAEKPRHLGTTAITASGPGEVIVIEQSSGVEAGSWGGILTLAAKLKGVEGVISEGLVRDVDEAVQHQFPIYARGATVRTARGRIVELANQVEIVVGGVHVQPGDYVIADGSGVVFIPGAHAAAVLEAAENIAQKEALMAKDLLAGAAVTEVMGANYEHMLAAKAKEGTK